MLALFLYLTVVLQDWIYYCICNRITVAVFNTKAVTWRCSVKKVFLEISQNSQENTCVKLKTCNFIKKETLAQLFACEFCEISKSIFSDSTSRWLLLNSGKTRKKISTVKFQLLYKNTVITNKYFAKTANQKIFEEYSICFKTMQL